MNLFWRKCFICGDYKDTSEYIECMFPYKVNHWYHKGCVHDVLCNPIDYKTSDIELAIEIIDNINRMISERDILINGALSRCSDLGEC